MSRLFLRTSLMISLVVLFISNASNLGYTAAPADQKGLPVVSGLNLNLQPANAPDSPVMQLASIDSIHSEIVHDSKLIAEPLLFTANDFHIIQRGEGRLPYTIQTVDQTEDETSLYVNGVEIYRFKSSPDDALQAATQARMVASRLYSQLTLNPAGAMGIHAALLEKTPVLMIGNEALLASGKESICHVSSLSNRLRAVLGVPVLKQSASKLEGEGEGAAVEQYKRSGFSQHGVASWYGPGFHGHRTASGCRFNMYALTAAHRSLPFGTLVRVTNRRNQRSCIVKITDRGPYAHGRIIDLSQKAAQTIGMSGTANVLLEVIRPVSQKTI